MLLKKIWVLVFSFMYLVSVDPMDWKTKNGINSTKKETKTYVSAFLDVLPERTTFSSSIPETSNEAGSNLISLFRPDLVTNISISKYSASLSHSDEDNRLFKIFNVIY